MERRRFYGRSGLTRGEVTLGSSASFGFGPRRRRGRELPSPWSTVLTGQRFLDFSAEGALPSIRDNRTLAQQRIVTFTTDFGLSEHYVGAMKGVVLNINPDAMLVDISNSVQSFDIL